MKKLITSILAVAFYATVMAQIPQNGLIAHFNCNGLQGLNSNVNGKLLSPNNYSSNTLSGGKTKPIPGPDRYNLSDSAISCEFTGYHYSIGKTNSIDNRPLKIKKQITFGCWVMINSYNQYNLSPLVFGAFGPQYASYGFQGNFNNGYMYAMVSSNTNNNQSLGKYIANEGTGGVTYYRHLMATIGADDTFRYYYQGRQVGAVKFQGDSIKYFNHSTNTPYFSIGADFTNNGWNGTGLNGSVDDVLVYNRALTPAEIWTIFNNSSKCNNSNNVKPGHLTRTTQGSTHLLTMADSTTWHNDNCEFEWYANNNYGITTKTTSGKSISITKNGTYKVKVVHQATRCWYWTNDIVVTDLGGSVGIDNNILGKINLYPNPANNSLTISNNVLKQDILIYNAQGQMILEQKDNSENSTIDISAFSRGMYFVRIGTITTKIIKE